MSRAAVGCIMLALAACDGGAGSVDAGRDAGDPVDAGPPEPTPCETDEDCPATYCNFGSFTCCVPARPAYDLCGDFIDQDCDRADTSCGDGDGDNVEACRPEEDPTGGTCDCDDTRADVRPAIGGLAGALEACDGIDNDCDGRVDEVPQCCDVCASLGAARDRADVCTEDGVCDCSTDPASGPCAVGRTCCASGCVDVTSDLMNCGACNAQCTISSDRCEDRACRCGAGVPCEFDLMCTGGSCG